MRTAKKQPNTHSGVENWKTKTFLVIVSISVSILAWGQSPAEIEQKIRQAFPDKSAVYLERSMTLFLEIEGDSLKGYSDVFEDMIFLKNTSERYAMKRVYGSHFNSVENLRAKTLVSDKARYKEMPVSVFKKNSAPDDHVFYDDSYFYSFDYPSVAAGNRTQLQYREVMKDIRFLSGFIFTTFAPQARVSYSIKAPKDVNLHFEVFNDPAGRIKLKKTEKGSHITYEWSAENLEEAKSEEGSPAFRYYEPHLICYVTSFKGKNGEHELFKSTKNLHNWYYTFIKDAISDQGSEALSGIVQEIRSKYQAEQDIVREVFYWVQNNIHYIAFEDGMRGFIPHTAAYTCEKKYGDCKDMATLIVGMLKIAGINAYPTWIGTRSLPYRYSQVPTPIVDNHMIATYISPDGKYYYLDATGRYSPFGLPTAMIQGKEALISFGPDKFEVREVPVIEKELNLITDSVSIRLEQNILVGQGVSTLHGISKASAGSYLERIEEKDVRNYILNLVGKGSNKFLLDKYTVSSKDNFDKPTTIGYEFRIGDYCKQIGTEMYINLNLSKDNQNRAINEQLRKTPHEFDFKYLKTEHIELEIPQGYVVDYLPPNETFDGKLSGYKVSYAVHGNKIQYIKHYYIDYLLMTPDQFKIWNLEVGKLSNMYQETVILKKKI